MDIQIRDIIKADIEQFPKEFALQGWDKNAALFQKYLDEQEAKMRKVFVATADNCVAGYVTLLPNDEHGPFEGMNIPTVCDFNVLEKYQKNGIGNMLLEAAEKAAATVSKTICLGVGMHHGYGCAQKLYVKRGYIPDGSGIWFNNEPLPQNAACINNDDLVLYMSKSL